MGILLTLLLIQDPAYAAGFQTNRDLEIQHTRILEQMSEDRASRHEAVTEIMGIQQDIRDSQDTIKPTLESVVFEMRRLNETLAIANAAARSQIQFAQTILDMFVKALGGVLGIGWAASKTPLGKRLLNGRKRE